MKIFSTAEYEKTAFAPLYELGEVVLDGWALGLPKLSEEELCAKSADADILLTSYDDVTRRVIDGAKRLKLIACTRATPVNIDTEAARERGIPVLYTPGRNSDSTAEMTIGLMLSIARRIPMAYRALKDGQFTAAPGGGGHETKDGLKSDVIWDMTKDAPYEIFKGVELKGRTLGILGYGSIGRRVGRIARAFGMELLLYDPYVGEVDVEEIGVRKAETLEEVMRESDFVTCHLKVSDETKGIVSRERIALMKPTAYFINASRGAVIDEAALIDALRERRIAGAAFDVYASEPIARDHPFVAELDNVVITPHIAGATSDAIRNHTRQIVADIGRFCRGERLLYEYRG